MNLEIFEKMTSNLFVENRLLKFGLVIMLIATISNHMLLRSAMNTHKTILVPAQLNTRVQILGDKASDEYIKMFAQVVSGLAFTYTPGTVANNFGELLTMFSPEAYPQTKKILTDLAGSIVAQKVSNVFYIQTINVDSAKNTFEITGQQVRWVEGSVVENVAKGYECGYKVTDGRFMLTSLSETGTTKDVKSAVKELTTDVTKSPILNSDAESAKQAGGAKQ
jgi:conjugal transfer pilus assembly protein TraE